MNNTRYIIAVLLLVLILATVVHANPHGSDNLDDMDYSYFLTNVGSHFEALGHNQFAQMVWHPSRVTSTTPTHHHTKTTSPMAGGSRAPASPHPVSQPHQPQSQPTPTETPSSNQYLSPWGMEFAPMEPQFNAHAHQVQQPASQGEALPHPSHVHDQCTTSDNLHEAPGGHSWLARLAHRGDRSSPQLPAPSFSSQPAFPPVSAYASVSPVSAYASAPPVPTASAFVDGYQQSVTYHEPAPIQQQPQDMDRSLLEFFPELEQAPQHQNTTIPVSQHERPQSMATGGVPNILPSGVTENPNYHPGMIDRAFGKILGWVRRAPTIGDRWMPALTLDTKFLAPPDVSPVHRSPSSASSAGSSGRSPSRRSKVQMLIGDLHCHYCNAAFNTQGDLTHHLRSHQPYSKRNHVCRHCHKRFQYRKDLARHLPRHDPNRPKFYCTYTGCKYYTKGFGRQDHLDRHLSTQHNRVESPQASRSSPNYAEPRLFSNDT